MAEEIKKGADIAPFQLMCFKCTVETWHRAIVGVDETGADGHPDDGITWRVEHQIVQCDGCKSVSYRSAGTHSEDYEEDYEGQYWRVTEKLFPPRQFKKTITEVDAYRLPAQTRDLLEETHGALANNQFILAGVGVRGLIETIVRDRQAKGKNLYMQIDDLVTQKILTPSRADILHKIRSLGNDAAHEAEPHDAGQLGLAIEIIESVLQEVYILPEKAKMVFKTKVKPAGTAPQPLAVTASTAHAALSPAPLAAAMPIVVPPPSTSP